MKYIILSLLVSILTGLISGDDQFELELAKSARSQVNDNHLKAPHTYHTSN